jgi:malonate transporter and related proteins
MQAILVVTLPFFALVLCGYLAARQQVLPEAAIPGLNAYVLYFALPCMLFRFGASMPFAQLIDPALIGVYALSALLIVALTVGLTQRRVGLKNAAFGALVAAFPNSGFMGVPLLVALHGDAAAGPVIGTLLVDLFLTSTLCLALAHAEPHDPAEGSALAAVGRSLRAALANPQPWAIALGALAAAASVRLPAPLDQFVKMLAGSASPVALFTIGAVLWRAGQHAHTRTPLRDYLPVALIKLVVQPLLVGVAGLAARAAGLPVSGFGLMVLVLAAALPSASNVSLLAERFGADNGRIARIIMASTALAFVSFTLIAWGLGGAAASSR